MPRSGSTLVEQILASHTAIEGLGELPDLDVVVGRLLSRKEGGPAHEFWISGRLEFRIALVQAVPKVVFLLTRSWDRLFVPQNDIASRRPFATAVNVAL